MKRYFFPLFIVALVVGTSCQPKVNVEKEKEAILAVILEEADAASSMDKDRVYATHVKGSEEIRLELGVYGYNMYKGWDEIGSILGDFLDGDQIDNLKISKENVIIKVTGNSAWLVCDNNVSWGSGDEKDGYSNIQIVFLEKLEGTWKISFTTYYSKPVEIPGIEETF
jgi:hypothetical protein